MQPQAGPCFARAYSQPSIASNNYIRCPDKKSLFTCQKTVPEVEKPRQMQYVCFFLFIAEISISGTLPTFIIILQTKFEAIYMAEWPDQGKIKALQHCHMRICCARLTFGINKKLICCASYLCLKKLFFIFLAHLA